MPPAGIELAILAGVRPQTHALGRAATEIGKTINIPIQHKLHHTLQFSDLQMTEEAKRHST